ncbi:MAG TPA: cupin domain-containing protein [Candidatus Acidoferrales bacterium]|nr:cupin domain-containing protein [Candidatus Acidoferrales bacterium]
MAEQERVRERLREEEVDPKLYYDYEGRFIKQKLERERMELLPRVVKPAMFAKGGHALGDLRVFERYTVAPLSALTCSFLEAKPNERTERIRLIPSMIAYVLEGSGECLQDDKSYGFGANDLVVIPPYATQQFVAGPSGFRAWLPQVRLWHVLGLLWQEQFEFKSIPEGTEPIKDASGELVGFRVPRGILGLEEDLEVRKGADGKRETVFRARRAVKKVAEGNTKYDWFLKRLVDENRLEEEGPRVIKGAERPWENTRQGKLKFYISLWTEVAARALDFVAMEIEPQGHTGKHRHIFEEMIYVQEGKGYDVHEETKYPWEAGDIICIPPMTAHQHFNDGSAPARLLSTWPRQLAHEFLGGIEHIGDASSWKK